MFAPASGAGGAITSALGMSAAPQVYNLSHIMRVMPTAGTLPNGVREGGEEDDASDEQQDRRDAILGFYGVHHVKRAWKNDPRNKPKDDDNSGQTGGSRGEGRQDSGKDGSKTGGKDKLSIATITRLHQSSWRAQRNNRLRGMDGLKTITDVLLYKRLKLLFLCMKVVGLFFVKRKVMHHDEPWKDRLKTIPYQQLYCGVMCIILLLNFVRSLFSFDKDEPFDTFTFFKILTTIFCYESVSRAVISYWACHRTKGGYQTLFLAIDFICYPDKIIPYEHALHLRVRALLVGAFLTSVANAAAMAYGLFGPNDTQDLFYIYVDPLNLADGSPGLIAIKAFTLLLTFLNSMVAMLSLSFYTIVCFVLYKEFQYLCRTFALKTRDDGRFTDDLEKFRLQHERRCQLVADADGIFKYYIANTFLTNVPQLCLLLYMVVYSFDEMGSRFVNAFRLVYVLLQMLVVSIAATLINSQAHSLLGGIYRISTKTTTVDLQMQVSIQMFLNRLTGTSIGLSSWDIFVINKATMLTVIGMILTYFFLLVQFRPSSGEMDEFCRRLLNSTSFQ